MSDEPKAEATDVEENDGFDDVDLEEVGEFNADTISSARSVGLDPADFDSEDALYRATDTRLRAHETRLAASGEPAKDETILADLAFSLDNRSDLDPKLMAELDKLAATTGQNFKTLLEKLNNSADRKGVDQKMDQMSKQIATLSAQNITHRLDAWIARSKDPKVQKYLGSELTGELESGSKYEKRRKALLSQSDAKARRQTGAWTMEGMFSGTLKKMTAKQTPTKVAESDSGPTRLARASEIKTGDVVGAPEDDKSRNAEAAAVVAKFQNARR